MPRDIDLFQVMINFSNVYFVTFHTIFPIQSDAEILSQMPDSVHMIQSARCVMNLITEIGMSLEYVYHHSRSQVLGAKCINKNSFHLMQTA